MEAIIVVTSIVRGQISKDTTLLAEHQYGLKEFHEKELKTDIKLEKWDI